MSAKRSDEARLGRWRVCQRIEEHLALFGAQHHAFMIVEHAKCALIRQVSDSQSRHRTGLFDDLADRRRDTQLEPL